MLKINNKSDCSGCGACQSICPVNALVLTADDEGFLYPSVNDELCIKCQKCINSCPIINKQSANEKEVSAYAAQTTNEETRKSSSSGGMFTEIATYVLNKNGVVFGPAFDESFCVKHIGVDCASDLEKLRGSKYVQSEIGTTYTDAKKLLDDGRLVLFTGTPCQIGGLYSFLGKSYDNLLTQDIICHGVPSPMMWQKYLEYREAKAASKTKKAFFRHKEYGWKKFSMQFIFSNSHKYTKPLTDDLYMRAFLRNLSLRPSCYSCSFKNKFRKSDFTLADFWGIEHLHPELDDDKGISLVLVNSAKARDIFNDLKGKLKYKETDFEKAIQFNSAMIESVSPHKDREEFFGAIKNKGFVGTKKYLQIPLIQRIKKAVKKIIRR